MEEQTPSSAALAPREEQSAATSDDTSSRLTLVEAVPLVLKRLGPLKPSAIKERLSEVGFTQPYNDNYFYTVISRLHKAGAIVRTPDKRLAVQNTESATAQPNGAVH
jgi:hypothetical protein